MINSSLNILSMFDGISGAQQALKNLSIPINKYYSSELDKYAIQVTQKNFPNTIQLGDVNQVNFDDYYGQIDLIVGGFPCQSFSCAGKALGFDDIRGKLFFKCVEAVNKIKPKYFLFENVASMKKEIKYQISKYLGVDFVTIDSALLTAQQRKRIYYCGILQNDGTYKTAYIPQPQDKGILLKDVLESGINYVEKSQTLTATYSKAIFINSIIKKERTMVAEPVCVAFRGRYDKDGKIQQNLEPNLTLKTNTLRSVSKDNMILSPVLYNQYNQRTLKYKAATLSTFSQNKTSVSGQVVFNPVNLINSNNISDIDKIYTIKDKLVLLNSSRTNKISPYKIDLPDGDYTVRKLTIAECCKLQGFPDYYCDNVSKTQGYKALGNSFTVPVIEHILHHLFNQVEVDYTNGLF